MADSQLVIDEIARKSSLSREEVIRLVQEKKEKIGVYLSDIAAAHLVGADLNVDLDVKTAELSLADVPLGASEVTTTGRILSVYPPTSFNRSDGTEGSLRRIVIYDNKGIVKVNLWDDKGSIVEQLGLAPGIVIRLEKGYVRAGLDSRPIINVGDRGSVQVLQQPLADDRFPTVDQLAKDTSEITPGEWVVAVDGVAEGEARESRFTRKDGSEGFIVSFPLSGRDGKTVRAVMWDKRLDQLPPIQRGYTLRLTDIKARMRPNGELELHGNGGTTVEVRGVLERPATASLTFRVLSVGPQIEEQGGSLFVKALVASSERKVKHLVARGEAAPTLSALKGGEAILCIPVYEGGSLVVCSQKDSIGKAGENELSTPLPRLTEHFTKIGKIGETADPVFVEAIALAAPKLIDVFTRAGEAVTRCELVVGDDTGEITLVAWRERAKILQSVNPGERLLALGFVSKVFKGQRTLEARAYSSLTKVVEKSQATGAA